MGSLELGVLHPWVYALGWALLHSLWQGLLIGAILAVALKFLQNASAASRYAAAAVALLGCAVWPALSFLSHYSSGGADPGTWEASTVAMLASAAGSANELSWSQQIGGWIETALPYAVIAWIAGVSILLTPLSMDWARVQRLLHEDVRPLSGEWAPRLDRLHRLLHLRRVTRVLESARVRVPMVAGWLKPTILLTASALLGLTPRQLELLVAHELAHIARHDYLFNFFQVIIETLLFYHPAVRWISRRVRAERELCCDDLVVGATGDSVAYARALTEMEGLRSDLGGAALAASDGNLSQRVRRLVTLPAAQNGSTSWAAGALLLLTAALLVPAARYTMQQWAPVESTTAAVQVSVASPSRDSQVESDETVEASVEESPGLQGEPASLPAGDVTAEPPPQIAIATPTVLQATLAPSLQQVEKRAPRVVAARQRSPIVEASTDTIDPPPTRDYPEIGPTATLARLDPEQAFTEAWLADPPSLTGHELFEPPPVVTPESLYAGGEPLKAAPPRFPKKALLAGIEGSIKISYRVDTDGKVDHVEIIEAQPRRLFDRSVKRAVFRWEFEPFTRDGVPIARTLSGTFDFRLDASAQLAATDSCETVTGSRICINHRHRLEEPHDTTIRRASTE